MQPSLVILLGAVALLAAFGWFLGWRRPLALGVGIPRAAFWTSAVALAPVLVVVLALQAGAEDRLRATGLTPHRSFRHVIGAAVGVGRAPRWAFRAGASADSLQAFYRRSAPRAGWNVVDAEPGLLVLRRSGEAMTILVGSVGSGSRVGFALAPEGA